MSKENPGPAVFRLPRRLLPALTAAFGIATICMLPVLGDIVSPVHITMYHLAGPPSALLLPVLFNLFLLTGILTFLLCASSAGSHAEAAIWCLLLGLIPWILLRSLSTLYNFDLPHRVSLSVFALCVLIAVMAWARSSRAKQAPLSRIIRIGSQVLAIAAILGTIMVVQLLWIAWRTRHLNDVSAMTPSAAVALTPHKPRIFWIVFDEMSYDQIFGSRYPGIDLPNLDQFAQQATVFTHAIPAGKFTDVILPSLISGVADEDIRASSDGQHLYLRQPSATPRWTEFQGNNTVFADARSLDYHPAIVGWYNPYCRLLAPETSSCFWTGQTELTPLFPAQNIRDNLFHPAVRLLREIPGFLFAHHVQPLNQITEAQLHIADYTAIYQAADKVLTAPGLDFVLLHLPIPHPNGIYDRFTGSLTTGRSTYLDNLVLADKYLGHVRDVLQRQGEWDDATILIMGDHSWRTRLIWDTDPRWSAEEQRASHGGQFDDRPFYALKLPHQEKGTRIDSPFHALQTRPLLDALLHQDILTPVQLSAWASHTK